MSAFTTQQLKFAIKIHVKMFQVLDMLHSEIRLSIVLKDKGFTAGYTIHIVTGNHYLYFPLVLSAWRLGGSVSCGDIALSADTIRYQVG